MANVGSASKGKVYRGNGNGASGTYDDIGAFSGLPAHGVLLAQGNSSFSTVSTGSVGQVFQSAGASADPAYSTATYPSTTTVSQLLYSSATNTVSGLSTANNGVLITSNSGVPSLLAAGTTGQILTATTGSPATWASPAIVNTSRPSFSARPTALLTDVTGDSTVYTVVWGTLLAQYGSGLNTGTGVFTAPNTGFYQFNVSVQVTDLLVGHTNLSVVIATTPFNYSISSLNPFVCSQVATGNYSSSGCVLAYMTAGDTASVLISVSGSTKTVDITTSSYISGFLVA